MKKCRRRSVENGIQAPATRQVGKRTYYGLRKLNEGRSIYSGKSPLTNRRHEYSLLHNEDRSLSNTDNTRVYTITSGSALRPVKIGGQASQI